MLGCDDDAPLAAVLFLQELDQHVGSIVREPLSSNRTDYVVLAEVFEVLSCVFSSLYPKGVILCRLALIWNLAIQQHQPFLHCHEILHELN